MRRYLSYLSYILKHKWYVMIECFKEGLYLQGILHDLSKLRPSEFIPYAKFFHNIDGSLRQVRDKTGYYKPTDTGDINFDYAWFLHQKRNSHHWQYWCFPDDKKSVKTVVIPNRILLEMICDWKGAKKVQGSNSTILGWWELNKDKMNFHLSTKKKIEDLLVNY